MGTKSNITFIEFTDPQGRDACYVMYNCQSGNQVVIGQIEADYFDRRKMYIPCDADGKMIGSPCSNLSLVKAQYRRKEDYYACEAAEKEKALLLNQKQFDDFYKELTAASMRNGHPFKPPTQSPYVTRKQSDIKRIRAKKQKNKSKSRSR